MKIWINIPSADAIRLALPRAGATAIEVDLATLTTEERLLLIEHTRTIGNGNTGPSVDRAFCVAGADQDAHRALHGVSINYDGTRSSNWNGHLVTPTTLDQAGLLASLREREQQLSVDLAEHGARAAQIAAEKAAREESERLEYVATAAQIRVALLALPVASQAGLRDCERLRLDHDGAVHSNNYSDRNCIRWTDVCTADEIAMLDIERARMLAEQQVERERRASEQAAAKETVKTLLVTHHGTDSQRQRLAEGLLPEHEVTTLLRCVALDPVKASLYVKLQPSDVEHDDDCGDNVDPKFSGTVEDVDDGLSTSEYAALVTLRAKVEDALPGLRDALPNAAVTQTLRQHRCWCDCEDSAAICRRGLLVTVTWHGLEASREYGLA